MEEVRPRRCRRSEATGSTPSLMNARHAWLHPEPGAGSASAPDGRALRVETQLFEPADLGLRRDGGCAAKAGRPAQGERHRRAHVRSIEAAARCRSSAWASFRACRPTSWPRARSRSTGKRAAVGNGVPLAMGRAIAAAVCGHHRRENTMSDYGDMPRHPGGPAGCAPSTAYLARSACALLPKASPTILLPEQRRKIHGYRDPRRRSHETEYLHPKEAVTGRAPPPDAQVAATAARCCRQEMIWLHPEDGDPAQWMTVPAVHPLTGEPGRALAKKPGGGRVRPSRRPWLHHPWPRADHLPVFDCGQAFAILLRPERRRRERAGLVRSGGARPRPPGSGSAAHVRLIRGRRLNHPDR